MCCACSGAIDRGPGEPARRRVRHPCRSSESESRPCRARSRGHCSDLVDGLRRSVVNQRAGPRSQRQAGGLRETVRRSSKSAIRPYTLVDHREYGLGPRCRERGMVGRMDSSGRDDAHWRSLLREMAEGGRRVADPRRDVRANLLHRIALLRHGASSVMIARFYDDYAIDPGCDGAVRGHLRREVLLEL